MTGVARSRHEYLKKEEAGRVDALPLIFGQGGQERLEILARFRAADEVKKGLPSRNGVYPGDFRGRGAIRATDAEGAHGVVPVPETVDFPDTGAVGRGDAAGPARMIRDMGCEAFVEPGREGLSEEVSGPHPAMKA